MGQHGIIIITKGEPLAAAMLQAKVARSADARIGLFQHPDAAIFFGQFMGQRSTAIGGAIVHQQQLKIRKALAQHAFHRGMQQHPGIIDRHDNTDQWGLLHTVHLPFGLYFISILMLTFYVSVQRTPCRMAAARQTGAAKTQVSSAPGQGPVSAVPGRADRRPSWLGQPASSCRRPPR